jgi:hypothetical protein
MVDLSDCTESNCLYKSWLVKKPGRIIQPGVLCTYMGVCQGSGSVHKVVHVMLAGGVLVTTCRMFNACKRIGWNQTFDFLMKNATTHR